MHAIANEEKDVSKNIDTHSLPKGYSKDASFLSVVYNSMIVRITIWRRYSAEAIGSIVQIIILMAVFYLFATAVGFRGFDFGTYGVYIFFLGAMLVMVFDSVAIYGPVNAMQRDLTNGTLEYLYFTPMNHYGYYLGYIVGTAIVNSLIGFIPLYVILVWYANLPVFNAIMILVTMFFFIISLTAMGIMVGLTVILFKQVQSLMGLVGIVMQFFTGGFIPLVSLPFFIKPIAFFFPHTYAYELIHYYSFNGGWTLMLPLVYNWLLIIGFTIIYTLVAIVLLRKVVKHAKQKGLHIL